LIVFTEIDIIIAPRFEGGINVHDEIKNAGAPPEVATLKSKILST
jgi:hypothetical protein